ncbi:formin-binding protein [Malassezia yamatoensis]|uniref:Formin-binding protein n=1 Tax=Malassezia yamatoensis TaxID=253288 RepID=A0AAJ6CEZ6_9BASI|nr:formin-binding protein [Malassezia yamatoensis]
MNTDPFAFCNAFWGENDAGYHVMQSFIKNTTRTLEDLRTFYQERPMRQALEKVRSETEAIARSHAQLVHSIRKEVESPLSDLMARSENVRRPAQVATSKLYKHKQMQMQYVQRAREKYEQDCTKINAYTAQSNLVQGKELDKLMSKLERVQGTVTTNEKDYQSYVRALQDTTYKWNSEWKSFLDVCQDVEEERQDFLKTNLWSFENAISSVCVTDDEACERVRVALEHCDSMRDVAMFVREFGTGANIPAAPDYINYAQGQAPPADPNQSAAQFHRLSTRSSGMTPALSTGTPMPPSMPTPSSTIAPTPNTQFSANSMLTPNLNMDFGRSNSRSSNRRTPPPQAIEPTARTPPPSTSNRNSMFSPGAPPIARMGSQSRPESFSQQPVQQAPNAISSQPPLHPMQSSAPQQSQAPNTQYNAGLPFQQNVPTNRMSNPYGMNAPGPNIAGNAAGPSNMGQSSASQNEVDETDPIAKALASLRMHQARKSVGPSSRPTSMLQEDPTSTQSKHASNQPVAQQPAVQNAPIQQTVPMQPPMQTQSIDPRLQQRPLSPAAAFMNPPPRSASPVPVEQILTKYGQSFPSERQLSNQASSQTGYEPADVASQRSGTPGGIRLDAHGTVTQDQMAENYAPPAGSNAPPAAPAPRPPTGQYSEAGEPILFYVKALYDYAATMPEEFSFTAGDIIAVTHTEPDGWWQGELLDEARRVPGANTFPSNFVVLLM